MKKLFILFIAVAGFGANLFAQVDNIGAGSSATIIRTINIAKTSDLLFGQITAGTAEGVVKLKADNGRTFPGTLNAPIAGVSGSFSNLPNAATFTVSGTASATYGIVLSQNAFTLVNTTMDGTMNVTGVFVTRSTAGTANTTGGVIDPTTGNDLLYVGADLTVGANQNPGLYSIVEAFRITVAYN